MRIADSRPRRLRMRERLSGQSRGRARGTDPAVGQHALLTEMPPTIEDMELTMRPEEFPSLDSMSVPSDKATRRRSGTVAASRLLWAGSRFGCPSNTRRMEVWRGGRSASTGGPSSGCPVAARGRSRHSVFVEKPEPPGNPPSPHGCECGFARTIERVLRCGCDARGCLRGLRHNSSSDVEIQNTGRL